MDQHTTRQLPTGVLLCSVGNGNVSESYWVLTVKRDLMRCSQSSGVDDVSFVPQLRLQPSTQTLARDSRAHGWLINWHSACTRPCAKLIQGVLIYERCAKVAVPLRQVKVKYFLSSLD